MRINKIGKAGTLESNDILVMVSKIEGDQIQIEVESIVIKQFGEEIKKTILEKVKEMNVEGIRILVQDKGALDFTIRARVETAIKRAF